MANRCNKIIVALMTLKEVSMKEFCNRCGLSENSMRPKLSKGAYKLDDLISYAKALGVDVGFKDGDNFYSFIENKENKEK